MIRQVEMIIKTQTQVASHRIFYSISWFWARISGCPSSTYTLSFNRLHCTYTWSPFTLAWVIVVFHWPLLLFTRHIYRTFTNNREFRIFRRKTSQLINLYVLFMWPKNWTAFTLHPCCRCGQPLSGTTHGLLFIATIVVLVSRAEWRTGHASRLRRLGMIRLTTQHFIGLVKVRQWHRGKVQSISHLQLNWGLEK